ncbi:MAG: alanine--tRNA ligase [Candidatus Helarchaeota archaeon]|nr:alanine--tRNA ligase [Candidatus Helarchaeota archaeon]
MLDKNKLRKIFGRAAYEVQLFKEKGFNRKQCPHCGGYYWTLNPDRSDCGDTNCIGGYTFIGKGSGKSWDFHDTVRNWCKFFEDQGHTWITEYPTVARWRDDIEFTIASIACFQPNILNGTIKPPANPLVLPQPCIRFGGKGFNDIDNVGRTGRHLTSFIMGGQHAFNSKKLGYKGYWMDRCIELDFQFLTQVLQIPEDKITLREDIWLGGGNFGPCLESFCDGLEIVNSVFMQYEVLPDDTYRQMEMTVVDVGWGVERVGWYAIGSPTVYEATFGPVLTKMRDAVGIEIDTKLLNKYYVLSGLLNVDEVDIKVERQRVAKEIGIDYTELEKIIGPLEALYAIADHLRTIIYTVSDGAIPSNVGGGYNLRTILRRAINLKQRFQFNNLDLLDICHWHIDYLQKTYKGVKNAEDSIDDIFKIEQERYDTSLTMGRNHINNLIKKNVEFDLDKLIKLYQSEGILPELVEEIAAEQGIRVEIPPDFFKKLEEKKIQTRKAKEVTLEEKLKDSLKDVPDTRLLYYEDQYLDSTEAKIIKILPGNNVILDQTIFYPLGGGQIHDEGYIADYTVKNVEKVGGVVIHELKKKPTKLKEGARAQIKINKDRRTALMRHHTGTHVINGAAKRVLGNHIWQAGAEKKPDIARLDITHYKAVSQEELWEIERLANEVVMETRPVEIKFMPRGEAEQQYGFTLYQGGIVPGKEIRVIDIIDWDVEACGGTHLKNTGEIGPIKIISATRRGDGIVRLTYTAGAAGVKAIQQQEKLLKDTAKVFEVGDSEVPKTAERFFKEWKQFRKEKDKLLEQLVEIEKIHLLENAVDEKNLKMIIEFFEGKTQDDLIKLGGALNQVNKAVVAVLFGLNQKMNLVILLGQVALDKGLHAGNIVQAITQEVGGGGGGKPELGQGGGIPKMDQKKLKEICLSIIRKLLAKK